MEDQGQSSMDIADTWEDIEQDHNELKAGQKIGRFMVIEQIGKGGMGVVYKAYDPELDRKVALKLITAAPKKGESDSVPHARLLREAQALAKISHPNVVSIFDVGSYGRSVYIAMEFVQGCNLRQWVEQHQPSEKEIVETYLAAGRGLACAHEAGLIHRDFKPDNVMIGDKGRVRILDFGLARATELTEIGLPELATAKLETLSPEQPLITPLTREGAYIGTLLYMAPEQFLQTDIDQRTDQFSFCVSLFESLYGRRPYRGNKASQLRKNVLLGNIQVPEKKQVSTWLQKIIFRGLAVDPEDRYATLEELLSELEKNPEEEAARKKELRRRRSTLLGMVLFSGLIAASGIWFGMRQKQQICQGAQQKIADVWTQDTRHAIQRSLIATKLSYSEYAAQQVINILDRYSNMWIDMHTKACEATRVQGYQSEELLDLRMLCLEERKKELHALSQVLISIKGDSAQKSVEKSIHAALALTPISDCAQIDTLSAGIKPPKDPVIRNQVADLRSELAQVKALTETAQFDKALELAQQILHRAKKTHYGPVISESLFWLGEIQRKRGKYEIAKEHFLESYWTALALGHDTICADSANMLTLVEGHYLKQPKIGHRMSRSALAIITRSGSNPRQLAQWHDTLASVYETENNIEKAMEHDQIALSMREKIYGHDHVKVAISLNNLGLTHSFRRDFKTALHLYIRSKEIFEKALGPAHPNVGMSLNNIGNTYYLMNETDKAIETHQKALALWEKALGPDHPSLGSTLNSLGLLMVTKKQYEKAKTYLKRMQMIYEKALGPNHPDLGMAHNTLAELYLRMEHIDLAIHHFRKAIAIREKALGKDHPVLVYSLVGLADALTQKKQLKRVANLMERAISICAKRTCETDLHAIARYFLAKTLWQTGQSKQRSRALALAQKAHDDLAGVQNAQNMRKQIANWLARVKNEG